MKSRIHIAYWIASISFICFGWYTSNGVDIALENIFIALNSFHIWFLVALFYGFYGALTFILMRLQKPVNKLGFWVHFLLTTIGIISIGILVYLSMQSDFVGYNDESVYYDGGVYEVYTNYSEWIGKLALIVVLVQLLFISSFIRSLIRPKIQS